MKQRQRFATRPAPRGPEIKHDDAALEILETHQFPAQGGEDESGRRPSGLSPASPAVADKGATTPPPVTPQSANAAFLAGDHEEAARQYKVLVLKDATKLGAWYRLGMSQLTLGRNAEAADALGRAAAAPKLAANARYNQACALSRADRADAALDALDAAVKAGFVDAILMESDADLAALRSSGRFAATLAAARKARRAVPERQFDFWVGSWEVRNPQGKLLGTNAITLRQKGRLVHEAWTSSTGNTGESMNFYDPGRGTWRQVWVADTGGVVEYAGKYENGAMRYQGRKTPAKGASSLVRATFFENDDGSVRQLLEQSTDGGRNWTATFDGHYTRRGK